jgi:hypothetical protein
MVDSRGAFRFSRREICIWPIPSASAIFAWLIFRPFRISLRVKRRCTFASSSSRLLFSLVVPPNFVGIPLLTLRELSHLREKAFS